MEGLRQIVIWGMGGEMWWRYVEEWGGDVWGWGGWRGVWFVRKRLWVSLD